MDKENPTTTGKEEEKELCRDPLFDVIGMATYPMEAFIEVLEEGFGSRNDTVAQISSILKAIQERQRAELKRIEDVVFHTLGAIDIQSPYYGHTTEVEGKTFCYGEYVRAVMEPKKATKSQDAGA